MNDQHCILSADKGTIKLCGCPRCGRVAADHIVRSPHVVFTPEYLAIAASYMDIARAGAQTTVIRYHGQAKKLREKELRDEFT
jgi:hypothetical protein